MKTAIIYTTKYGFTFDCAKLLKSKLRGEVSLINVDETKEIDTEHFDKIIIGSPVYVGQINKEIKKYVEDKFDKLIKKEYGLFLCCGFSEKSNEVFETCFPNTLLERSKINTCFGGELRVDRMKPLDKMMTKAIKKASKESYKEPTILDENIESMANIFNYVEK